jgi:micrococcal nuclease
MNRYVAILAFLAVVTPSTLRAQNAEYVASSRGQVYYWSGCSAWKRLSPKNRVYFGTAEDAERAGYRPSKAAGCAGPERISRIANADRLGERCVVLEVIDGDTFRCSEFGSIRLLLVDAPEIKQSALGAIAKRALQRLLVAGDTVSLEFDVQRFDKYRRTLAYVRTRDGLMVNREMARRGLAVALVYPPNVKYVEVVRAAVDSARNERVHMWADDASCTPAEFRLRKCQVN